MSSKRTSRVTLMRWILEEKMTNINLHKVNSKVAEDVRHVSIDYRLQHGFCQIKDMAGDRS